MEFTFKTIIGVLIIFFGLGMLFNINVGKYIFPIFLIFFGISLLFNRQMHFDQLSKQEHTKDGAIEYAAVFNSLNKKVVTDAFQGGKVDVVFAGGDIDLRNAKIPKGQTVTLEVNAVFGGVKIIVPPTWSVNSSVTGVFGGFENKAKLPASGKEQGRLNLTGAAVFGGGSVEN